MDYSHLFSSDVPSFMRSPVREIFRKVDLSAICSFAGGYPAAVTFPVEDLRRLPGLVLDKYGTKSLQYGATQGVPELREAIAARYGVPVSKVQITTSSQQGIDVCTRILCDPPGRHHPHHRTDVSGRPAVVQGLQGRCETDLFLSF